ncbi:response regulator [Flavobacterium procerum]|uniref:Response regulator n=1 Tax=Flavobacterium procerum TaxID=1455569 RepID=A0ABV6BZJ9_9FLAO
MEKVILLADDDVDDTEMFCEALDGFDQSIKYYCSVNGSEMMDKLYSLEQIPELIFLDLNMPLLNGLDCLKILKEQEKYRQIPVIMISTSSHKNDMDAAAALGALCYFVKPSNFRDFKNILHLITSNLGDNLKEVIINLHAGGSKHIFYLD